MVGVDQTMLDPILLHMALFQAVFRATQLQTMSRSKQVQCRGRCRRVEVFQFMVVEESSTMRGTHNSVQYGGVWKFPRGRGYWQIIVFVGARDKHGKVHETGSSPYILGDDCPQPQYARTDCKRNGNAAQDNNIFNKEWWRKFKRLTSFWSTMGLLVYATYKIGRKLRKVQRPKLGLQTCI